MTDRARFSLRFTACAAIALSSLSFAGFAREALIQPATSADPVARRIGDRIVRFDRDADAADKALPSFALITNPDSLGPAPADFSIHPKFTTAPGGKQSVTIAIAPGTSLYGTGEVFGPLLRNGKTVTCWNTDAYGYGEKNPSLYQSHPWTLAVREDGSAFGVLADTTWRCEIDLTDGIRFTADGPAFPVIVIDRESPQAVMKGLAELIGTIAMPPRWALGYHQCRYSYEPEARVREIAKGFRDRHIPCDVIWMDIDYMDEYRVFTFDKKRFPDPKKLNADLHAQQFHTIWMIDPGIQAKAGYGLYDSGTKGDHWVRSAGGDVYKGEVWPGYCVFPDYTRADTNQWWAGLYKDFMAQGIDGVWNDMNEPAVFNVASKTMPEDNMHRGGITLPGGEVSAGPHARFHNVYGMLMARATREGIIAANPEKRPFVLTRAGYIGSHRYAATWTGDNSAEWDDLEASIPMALNLGLSGQPFAGPDIGGFNGNGDGKMFARWMGVGAMLPFARGHTGKGNINKEPWAFGLEVEETCRLALQRRYRLLPYLYTTFHEASVTGLPVARPLFFADPKDPVLRSEDDAFLLGGDLMVVGKVTPLRDRAVSLPKQEWPRVWFFESDLYHDDLPDIRIRPGSIVPVGPVVESTATDPTASLTLIVALEPGSREVATGTLYEDAGDGYGYQKGEYLLSRYEARIENKRLELRLAGSEGNMARPKRKLTVIWLTRAFGMSIKREGDDGEAIRFDPLPTGSSRAPGINGLHRRTFISQMTAGLMGVVGVSNTWLMAQPQADLVQPESLSQGFILVVTDKSGAAKSDSPIFIASNHNGWDPGDVNQKLTQRSDSKWQIVLPKPKLDSRMAFKFTRGSWDAEELDAKFGKIENRSLLKIDASKLKPGEQPIIELTIENFADKQPTDAASNAKNPYREIKATGTIRRVEVTGGGVPMTRDLLVWLPPGYDDEANVNSNRRYPVLYMQDGQNIFEQLPGLPGEWQADETATRLIAEKAIEPIIIVGIPHAGMGRAAEYLPINALDGVTSRSDAYVDFLVREVVPRVERAFRVKSGPENTAIGGSSLGGAISLYAATRHPEVFGKVLAESPTLELRGKSVTQAIEEKGTWPSRVYIGMGGRELEKEGADSPTNQKMVQSAKDLDAILAKHGVGAESRKLVIDADATHNEAAWAKRLPEALKFLFPNDKK